MYVVPTCLVVGTAQKVEVVLDGNEAASFWKMAQAGVVFGDKGYPQPGHSGPPSLREQFQLVDVVGFTFIVVSKLDIVVVGFR